MSMILSRDAADAPADRATGAASEDRSCWRAALLLAIVMPAFSHWVAFRNMAELFAPQLADTDTLMRLVRVRSILEQGWGDGVTAMGGVAYSEVLQWTAPLDALLIGLTELLQWAGVDRALEWSAIVISPILLGLTCAAMIALAPTSMPRPARMAAVLVVVMQPALIGYTLAGRGDHHALMFLLFALAALSVIRTVLGGGRAWAWLAGAMVGLGLWVSVEALVWWCAAIGALAVLWAFGEDELLSAAARLALAAASVATMAWGVEAALGFPAADALDRLSLAWLTILITAAVALSGLRLTARPGWQTPRRLTWLALTGAVTAAFSVCLVPEIVRGPFGDVDPAAMDLWQAHVREMRPPDDLEAMMKYLTIPVLAACVALGMARRADRTDRVRWLVVAALVGGFAVMTALQVRWSSYASLSVALVVAPLASAAASSRRPLHGVVAAILLVGAILLPMLPYSSDDGNDGQAADAEPLCDARTIVAAVPRLTAGADDPLQILTAPDFGPALAFYTSADAALVPAHRMTGRIVALSNALRGADDGALRSVLTAYGVGAVALCDGGPGRGSFDGGPNSAYRRIMAGEPLTGFERASIGPEALRIYRVAD